MGSYLSEPVTEKVSSDETSDKLKCGASSMQGWRVSQEDAHNCILDFDTNTSLFAVYDGHGGREVALYSSQKLPDYIKQMEAYKRGDYEKALVDAFLSFDSTIATNEVIEELKEIAGEKEVVEEEEEENVSNLYEEASMPIEQVIEKYTANLLNPKVKHLKDSESVPVSPFLKAKREGGNGGSATAVAGSSSASCSSLGDVTISANVCDENTVSSSNNANEASSTICDSKPDSSNASVSVSSPSSSTTAVAESANSSPTKASEESPELPDSSNGSTETPSKPDQSECTPSIKDADDKEEEVDDAKPTDKETTNPDSAPTQNGEISPTKVRDNEEQSQKISSSTPQENGDVSRKEDSSDEEEVLNSNVEGENSDSSIGEEEDEEEEDEDDMEDEEELEDEDEESLEFAKNMREEPGSDSGCTAVVALLKENRLYVANAGDSRCIICRNGKAVEMSIDHKPEDDPERERIIKAGGKVTTDGRVNGGLNLSRAIGDHAYKQNKDLSPREQMITALPDVQTLTINPSEDEFMVLACDGIWNSMSSQEVVDFVKPRIKDGICNLSRICEEMFDACLAPNTLGDGTGCDNMTAIIVQFKPNICKRSAPDDAEPTESAKRAKTEVEPDPKPEKPECAHSA